MRARTTIAAGLVVAVALVAVGFLVVTLLRHNLVGSAELKAEFQAQTLADKLSTGTPPADLTLPDDDDELVQIVDANGKVVKASEELEDQVAVGDFAPQVSVPKDSETETDDGDDDDDDDADDYDDDRGDDEPGKVSPDIEYQTLTVPREDGRFRFAAVSVLTPDEKPLSVYSGVSLSTQDEAVNDVSRIMLMALPVLLIVVAAVTWLVTGRALRPVSAIRAEMAEITAGDLSRRVPEPAGRDEIFALARTTNQTLEALETAVAQQRRFIADASHELRSPLAILRAQLEVAGSHPELLDIDATLNDVVRLQSLATDLLLLARLDAGERPSHARLNLTELVREEVARRAATDRVPVHLSLAEGVEVLGVTGHLVRVLTNLLDNAQRHTDDAVAVSVRSEAGQAILSVEDDGDGIPEDKRESVFGRFTRLDDARSRDAGGAGLGLAIVRDVVTAHGGTIAVARAESGGARFVVRLPLAKSDSQ
ncbi:sensor histidine kinase [Stackebrandtia nassauensis]|uniref:histidine kinase n=1 Tax=Stackebrandtia nassauensis (strain DSM 44728 / CIP 108903 / NRRL B-16338 / NBRC 102104 / LLR-40K-21) TaxID=446470 RepID=D3Q0R3_STANL|nr:HAMP domain-containing sensor histidine kinase [Stackebrandtia nassauensis]ADD41799.1 histidine kinase [Stackebrandtia nassauensis DSM 44728]